MKVIAVADIHGELPEIDPCDLFLLAGDIAPNHSHNCNFQECWFDAAFKYWIKNVPAKKKIIVAGNHDFLFEARKEKALKLIGEHCTYLQDDYCYYNDLKIYGLPWQPYNGGWAFNLYEFDLAEKYAKIPHDTHIIVSHGPPHGYGDKVPRKLTDDNETQWPEPAHSGSPSFTKRIQEIKPKLVVFGHIHQGFGTYQLNNTILINCACKPVTVEI
jgi:Icc-related predicted phosphoesterase